MKAIFTIVCLIGLALLGSCGHDNNPTDGMNYDEIMAQKAANDWDQRCQNINIIVDEYYNKQTSYQNCVDRISKVIDDHNAIYATVYNTDEQRRNEINDQLNVLANELSQENKRRVFNLQKQANEQALNEFKEKLQQVNQNRPDKYKTWNIEIQKEMKKSDRNLGNCFIEYPQNQFISDYWNGKITSKEYYDALNNLTGDQSNAF